MLIHICIMKQDPYWFFRATSSLLSIFMWPIISLIILSSLSFPCFLGTISFKLFGYFKHIVCSKVINHFFMPFDNLNYSFSLQSLSHSGHAVFISVSNLIKHSPQSISTFATSPYRFLISSVDRCVTALHPHWGQDVSILYRLDDMLHLLWMGL